MELYEGSLLKEIDAAYIDRKVDTIFWGGGTPGILPAKMLERIGGMLCGRLPEPPIEWSVEMAPSTVKVDRLRSLKDLGVNRISLGVQSFQDNSLEVLGRKHSKRDVYQAIDLVREIGFENLNLDLIFGLPNQRVEDWIGDLKEAFGIYPTHISTYCLTFEDDTPLFIKMKGGQIKAKDDVAEAAFYETTWQFMADNGYLQYEISNYAIPGYECLHNENTWRMGEWMGFGPSAATQVNGKRFSNVSSLKDWLIGFDEGKPRLVEEVSLTQSILAHDCLIFGFRMNQGVFLEELSIRFPSVPLGKLDSLWDKFRDEGLMVDNGGGNILLTPKGRLLADAIAVEISEKFEEAVEIKSPFSFNIN
ncbi:MAG: Oxygen-independent coproporphyrinogen-III oxidase-like protein YqeR [Candidatus Moanabacter tarae]|uniref:Heme chaperone HemW n=1 Tax=Candidatus Moanibacter tarae TaxID=2200854 RepID=A0A2Z4AKZ4_9BACT|nr:MAG: Oxygen-independent coproporphyrinogen-III oxidase-like protein YqeR [Candidatus Moanabacter tarae]|tara:strand:+ start:3437 stop:4522 length:1086 start_codon:yes stop_codon:yes gene_type:complete